MKYYVTIDREEWDSPRRWQAWRREWWAVYGRDPRFAAGIGRTVFEVDRHSRTVHPAFSLPQRLDREVYRQSWVDQSSWTKTIARGLRAISPLPDGSFVVNDVFGVYHCLPTGEILNYVTLPRLSDVHCARPNTTNSRLLIANTGAEEAIEVDWSGVVHLAVSIPQLFGLAPSARVQAEVTRTPDARLARFDHTRELFHFNWVEWLDEGEIFLASFHAPGTIATVKKNGNGWELDRRWSYYPHCHGPTLDPDSRTIMAAVSKTDQVVEFDLDTGLPRWVIRGIGYGKRVARLSADRALVTDCNGRRLVEVDRESGQVVWECPVPGRPYDVAVVEV